MAALLAEFRPQEIVNYAAETHVDRSIDAPSPFVSTNVAGTWQLLEQSLHYWRSLNAAEQAAFRFLQISTDEVFGPIDPPHFAHESSPYRPSSPYAASKAAADHFVRLVSSHLWSAGAFCASVEQLRPVPVPGKARSR